MADYDFDLFVIGAGSGGVRAARISAGYGARVAVAEERDLGGTCVNVGCVPKKLMVYASHFAEDFEDAALGYGWSVGERSFDWATFIANKDREIGRLNGIYGDLLDGAGVTRMEGRARVEGPHSVAVGDQRYTAAHILVATGGWPRLPDEPGSELAITSNEIFHLPEQPRRLLVVGGGYIATEFACIFHGLGSEVVQLYRGPLFLRGFDDDVRTTLAEEMHKKGIDLRFDRTVQRLEQAATGVRATLSDGNVVEADQVLCAIGRTPLTAGLGLTEAGVELDANGAVVVDEYSCSSAPSIHAIGDVTDRINLTPVAIHEGMCLAATLFDGRPTKPDHRDVPKAVFSQPTIGSVGLSEAEAREQYTQIDVYRSRFRPMKHTLTGRDEKSLMKILVDRASDRVVGLHVVGPEAGEIVQGFAVAIKCGATKAQFDATMGIHPTAAEELVTMREPASD
ncbi:MAG: glutathione-disulfide reductase [Deltaproteobacteria bacterium]|nr:glutathione-disulfide reductase [Deltaproteobacteria bacterium]MBW2419248.1 glutathione-disulfide reductase [Deltaproteobacteria bacterium]